MDFSSFRFMPLIYIPSWAYSQAASPMSCLEDRGMAAPTSSTLPKYHELRIDACVFLAEISAHVGNPCHIDTRANQDRSGYLPHPAAGPLSVLAESRGERNH